MNFNVKYTDGYGCYVVTTEDGRAALADTRTGQFDWAETDERFLRFGPFCEVEHAPDQQTLNELDALLEGRVKPVEVDAAQIMQLLRHEFGDTLEEGE